MDSVQNIINGIAEKTTYIESRLDRMKPMPHDVLRHIMQFLSEFDENRGGSKIWADGIMTLKMRFLGGIWLKNMTEDQIKVEWNTMLKAASVALTEGGSSMISLALRIPAMRPRLSGLSLSSMLAGLSSRMLTTLRNPWFHRKALLSNCLSRLRAALTTFRKGSLRGGKS